MKNSCAGPGSKPQLATTEKLVRWAKRADGGGDILTVCKHLVAHVVWSGASIGASRMSAVDVNQAPAALGRVRVGPAAPTRSTVWQRIWRDRIMLLLILPGVLYFIL